MSELKPCPFCGGNAIVSYDPDGIQDIAGRKWAWTIVCDRCCATSGLAFLKEKAIAAWNRRVGDDIKNAPAVDTVEVVRCKDCIYYETGKDYLPYCNHADGGIDDYPREDDFCSYGERRSYDGTDN